MLHTDVLSMLTQKERVTDEKWYEILEARKAFMMRHIDDIGQMKLGDISIWKSPGDMSLTVSEGTTEVSLVSQGFTLNTRGVFVFDRSTFRPISSRRNKMAVYGFTRSGKWLIASIEIIRCESDGPEVCQPDLVKTVRLESSSPDQWLTIHPCRIFTLLGGVIKSHAERRERLWREAEEMYYQTRIEDQLLLTNSERASIGN